MAREIPQFADAWLTRIISSSFSYVFVELLRFAVVAQNNLITVSPFLFYFFFPELCHIASCMIGQVLLSSLYAEQSCIDLFLCHNAVCADVVLSILL